MAEKKAIPEREIETHVRLGDRVLGPDGKNLGHVCRIGKSRFLVSRGTGRPRNYFAGYVDVIDRKDGVIRLRRRY